MNYYEIEIYLNKLKEELNNILLYIDDEKANININEIHHCLLLAINSIDDITNKKYCHTSLKTIKLDKNNLINYLYYLEDKIDMAYKCEVHNSISRFIKNIEKQED